MRFFRPFFAAKWIYPEAIFRIKAEGKTVCLTFDDSPEPESTPLLLALLKRNNIKAMFFFSGNKAERHQEIVKQVIDEGHLVGNHGFYHIDGWTSSCNKYIGNVEKAANFTSPQWFRPPYGRLGLRQYYRLKKKYRIVFWDIMPYDFDKNFSPADVLNVMKKKLRNGSIIALHDFSGSSSLEILDSFIDFAKKQGYTFALPALSCPKIGLHIYNIKK